MQLKLSKSACSKKVCLSTSVNYKQNGIQPQNVSCREGSSKPSKVLDFLELFMQGHAAFLSARGHFAGFFRWLPFFCFSRGGGAMAIFEDFCALAIYTFPIFRRFFAVFLADVKQTCWISWSQMFLRVANDWTPKVLEAFVCIGHLKVLNILWAASIRHLM